MKHLKHTVCMAAMAVLLFTVHANAREITVDPTAQFTFSAEDFISSEDEMGIFLTAVPSSNHAELRLGDRVLRAGDSLNRAFLDQLSLQTECVTPQEVAIEYYTVTNDAVSASKALTLSILPKKNDPPEAKDSNFETYKNIANTGTLCAEDPEDDVLTYALVDEPKRGTVTLHEDGTFTYTPEHNKVGKDSFTFTATDEAGNVSAPATVSIQIVKPTERTTYADMTDDPDAFTAMWMREEGLYAGDTVGGNLCFSPDEIVTRGEFLVMVMKLVQAEPEVTAMTTGFADESSTPEWLQPYLATALRNGMITGISTEEGLVFQASADLSKAEAAVMLQNILQLPPSSTQAVFSEDQEPAVPSWAADAAAALSHAGVDMEILSEVSPMTRREASRVLYQIDQLIEDQIVSTFYWVQ